MNEFKFSVWAASCIALGLIIAYADGVSGRGILGSAFVCSLLIAGVIATTYIWRLLKQKRPPEH